MGTMARATMSVAVTVILAVGSSRTLRAEGGGCGEEGTRPPSAGHWKGTFKFSFEMSIAGLPATFTSTTTSDGPLEFDLGRPEEDDPPRPAPADAPPLRPPLRS